MAETDGFQQTVVAPIAALTMAGLLYVYARTSIRAAKLNAQRTREADGGQLSWYKEGLRRHGTIEKVDEKGNLKQALLGKKAKGSEDTAGEATADGDVDGIGRHSAEEEKLGKFMGKGEAGKK